MLILECTLRATGLQGDVSTLVRDLDEFPYLVGAEYGPGFALTLEQCLKVLWISANEQTLASITRTVLDHVLIILAKADSSRVRSLFLSALDDQPWPNLMDQGTFDWFLEIADLVSKLQGEHYLNLLILALEGFKPLTWNTYDDNTWSVVTREGKVIASGRAATREAAASDGFRNFTSLLEWSRGK